MRTDESLLERAQAGDAAAFEEFYDRHVSAVVTFIRRRVPTAELAFDLTAETFAAVVEGLDGYDAARGSARGWLFAIASNEMRQAWRRGQVEDRTRRRLGLDRVSLDDADLQRVDERVDESMLVAALAGLPAAEREAVERRVLEDRSYLEISLELQCSELVVRKRVSRGLRRLRKIAEETP